MGFRGFVAVPVPADPPLVALLAELDGLRAAVKPVEPGNLHFTLSFLGQVADEEQDAIARAVRDAAREVEPFEVELQHVGAFPNARHPRVVWAGVADPKPLVALALRTREALAKIGAPSDDKDFRAHLTLARVREGANPAEVVRFLQARGAEALGRFRVEETRLYRSLLSPKGPTYETLASAPLGA